MDCKTEKFVLSDGLVLRTLFPGHKIRLYTTVSVLVCSAFVTLEHMKELLITLLGKANPGDHSSSATILCNPTQMCNP